VQSSLETPQACGGEGSVSTAGQTDTSSSQEGDVTKGFQKALSKKKAIIVQLQAQVVDLEERVADLRAQLDRERTARQEKEEVGKELNPTCVETHQPELRGGQDITDEAPNPEPRQMEVRARSPQGEIAWEHGRPTNMPASVVQSTREGGKGRRAPTDSAIRRVNEQRARWKGADYDTDEDDDSEENDLDDQISTGEDEEDVATEDWADDEHSTTEDMDLDAIISHTRILMQSMFGPTAWNAEQDAIMREASRYGSHTYGVQHANEWALTDLTDSRPDKGKTVGKEYLPRPEVVEACETFIRQHGGLTQASIVQLASMEEARLNPKRIGVAGL
jgi:TolA-binding protein